LGLLRGQKVPLGQGPIMKDRKPSVHSQQIYNHRMETMVTGIFTKKCGEKKENKKERKLKETTFSIDRSP